MTDKKRVQVTVAEVGQVLSMLSGFASCHLGEGECHYLIAQVENDNGEMKWRWKVAVNQHQPLLPSRGFDGK